MFENNLYQIVNFENAESKIKAQIVLNPEHEIFKGHFPEMPILPGVCTMQIVKELCIKATNNELSFTNGDNIKFTSLVIPNKNEIITVEISIISFANNLLTINCMVVTNNNVLFKMKASYLCKP